MSHSTAVLSKGLVTHTADIGARLDINLFHKINYL